MNEISIDVMVQVDLATAFKNMDESQIRAFCYGLAMVVKELPKELRQ